MGNIPTGTPSSNGGVERNGSMKKFRFSTKLSHPYPSFRTVSFSMTLSDPQPRVQDHDIIILSQTRKWYNKIELYLQWQTNSKWYMIYRTAPFSTTLNDPNFNVMPLFDAGYLRNGTRYRHSFNRITVKDQ